VKVGGSEPSLQLLLTSSDISELRVAQYIRVLGQSFRYDSSEKVLDVLSQIRVYFQTRNVREEVHEISCITNGQLHVLLSKFSKPVKRVGPRIQIGANSDGCCFLGRGHEHPAIRYLFALCVTPSAS